MTRPHDAHWVKDINLSPPSLADNTADADRLAAALKKELDVGAVHMDIELIQQLPDQLRRGDYRLRAVLFKDTAGNGILVHLSAASDPGGGLWTGRGSGNNPGGPAHR